MSQAVPALIKALNDDDENVRFIAFRALVDIGSPAVVPALTAALDDVKMRKLLSYAENSPLSKSVRQKFAKELHHADWQVRRRAAEKIGAIGFNPSAIPPDPLVASLLQALKDQNSNVRASVAAALVINSTWESGNLPPAIATALKLAAPNLLESLKHGDPQARLDAILVFRKLGSLASPALATLRQALADENWLVRYGAAIALSKINPRETAVIPVLAEIFQDQQRLEELEIENGNLEHDDLQALGEIASPEAIAVLIHLLQVSDEKFRYSYFSKEDRPLTSIILLGIGFRIIPALIAALHNPDIRFLVADTLGQMGSQAIPPLMAIIQAQNSVDPAVKEILADKDADRRRAAAYALGKLGRKHPAHKNAVIKILTNIMTDKNESVGLRWQAASALQQMGNNVGSFFADMNLPRPQDDTCISFEEDDLHGHFDTYAARCLFFQGGRGAGGQELFGLVRDLMTKSPSPGSITPQPQPTPAGR